MKPAVIAATMDALAVKADEERSGWLAECPGGPDQLFDFFGQVIDAALVAIPLVECNESGHDLLVVSNDGVPGVVLCARCGESWGVDSPVGTKTTVAPAGEQPEPTTKSTKQPLARTPGLQPPREQEEPVDSAADAQSPDPPATDPPAEEVAVHCTKCGGELESGVFAAEVAKNFRGACLCRDCLLECESCGSVMSLDEARMSFIRRQVRLCKECNGKDGAAE